MTWWEWTECSVQGCGHLANRDVRLLPICYEHGLEVARRYALRIVADERRAAAKTARSRVEKAETKAGNREGSLVYYVRIGNYIKVGYSTRLRSRFTTLRADELLAVEPGGAELERQRHEEFDLERIDRRRENFADSDRLLQHIAALNEKHGLPRWATLPRTSIITRRTEES